MASTSVAELARQCLAGSFDPELAREVIAEAANSPEAARDFFRVVIEPLGDHFDPRLCEVYVRLFTAAIEYVEPELRAAELLARYARVSEPRRCALEPSDVFVLSRITLGADVVVTSTLLEAALERWPNANVWFVGPVKNWALFAGRPRVERLALEYPRGGTLRDRIALWRNLRSFFEHSGGVVLDPDSRLTQLGLLPVCPEEQYFFFPSRSAGADSAEPLRVLTRAWVREVIGVDARSFVAPAVPAAAAADVTVSFGVGDNAEKRVGGSFERELLEGLRGRRVLLDTGAGGAERERVLRAAEGLAHVRTYAGEYAPFAAAIAGSNLYVGYDSAGQHVAAASRTPLVSVFAGFVSERMFQRWRPGGQGRTEVVKVAPGEDPESVLARVLEQVATIARE